ncbi:MAG: alpha/beta hydrolase [Caldilineaceae bacterium]
MWQSAFIETNGLRLHYTRTGGAKPPVILAHGFSDDGLCWTPVAQILAADYDVIMVDARGHGRSDGPEEGYGSAESAADLAGVIAGLGLQKPAVLGHSMGAATALALAGLYPDLPGAILLEDPPAWWFNNPAAAGNRRGRFGDRIVNLKRKTREEMIAEQHASSPRWSEAELGPWADSKLRLSFYVLNQGSSAAVDWPATVKQITCPTLLITADPEQGAIVSAEAAAAFQAILPQAQVEHIPDAGHSIRREQFARYMAVVQEFLGNL